MAEQSSLPLFFRSTTPVGTSLGERLKRNSPNPEMLKNIAFARWHSVTGPTMVKAWPDLAQRGSSYAGDPSLATEATTLTTDIARFIARNCLTAEVTNSTTFHNRINSRIFTVPEIGLVAYAIVFACVPLKSPTRMSSNSSRASSMISPIVYQPDSNDSCSEQLFVWFFLFDSVITRVIEMRAVLEEVLFNRYVYLLRAALSRNLERSIGDNFMTQLPDCLIEILDLHAVAFEKIFNGFSASILLPDIRFNSTVFAVTRSESEEDSSFLKSPNTSDQLNTSGSQRSHQESPSDQEDGIRASSITKGISWLMSANSIIATNDDEKFIRKSLSAFLASGGRALVLGRSSKSINSLVHTLAMFLPIHCRRLCRLAAARPGETFMPGFYVQGLVGSRYPTGTELLMTPHSLAIINTHEQSVCITQSPAKHRFSAAAFTAARIRDVWEGIHEEKDATTTALAALPLSDIIPEESIVGDFLTKLGKCSATNNSYRRRFVESTVADFYTRAFCLMQLVDRSLEHMTKVSQGKKVAAVDKGVLRDITVTKREIAKLLDLRKPEGDLAVLAGVGELLKPGFVDALERCPP